MNKPKRIVIAEDQTLVREGLKSLISGEEGLEVIAEAENGLEAIQQVARHTPDLLLLDLAMPKMNGISAITEVKQTHPETKILALTFHTSDEYILAAFQAGADQQVRRKPGAGQGDELEAPRLSADQGPDERHRRAGMVARQHDGRAVGNRARQRIEVRDQRVIGHVSLRFRASAAQYHAGPNEPNRAVTAV